MVDVSSTSAWSPSKRYVNGLRSDGLPITFTISVDADDDGNYGFLKITSESINIPNPREEDDPHTIYMDFFDLNMENYYIDLIYATKNNLPDSNLFNVDSESFCIPKLLEDKTHILFCESDDTYLGRYIHMACTKITNNCYELLLHDRGFEYYTFRLNRATMIDFIDCLLELSKKDHIYRAIKYWKSQIFGTTLLKYCLSQAQDKKDLILSLLGIDQKQNSVIPFEVRNYLVELVAKEMFRIFEKDYFYSSHHPVKFRDILNFYIPCEWDTWTFRLLELE